MVSMLRGARTLAAFAALAAGAAGCGFGGSGPTRAVTGVALLEEEAALPPEAELVVSFRATDGSATITDRAAAQGRQPPLHFRLWVPSDRGGLVDVAVTLDGEPTWTSAPREVGVLGRPIDLGIVTLVRAEAPEQDALAATQPPVTEADPQPWRPAAAAAEPAPPAPVAEAAPPQPTQVAAPLPEQLRCGETEIGVAGDARLARLTVGAVEVELVAVEGAEGRRYEAPGDPQTSLSATSDGAVVTLAGERLPPCNTVD